MQITSILSADETLMLSSLGCEKFVEKRQHQASCDISAQYMQHVVYFSHKEKV